MTRIRRYFVENAPVFITSVCFQRQPFLQQDNNKELLLSVMREVKAEQAYRMLGYVILDDHFHWLILPERETAFPRIMQSVKLRFARRMSRPSPHVWQRRYWDHVIRSEHDLWRHLDYIHFNPVKHGVADTPAEYRWSTFSEYLRLGRYSPNWGQQDVPDFVCRLVPE